jgi:hypothetical protein
LITMYSQRSSPVLHRLSRHSPCRHKKHSPFPLQPHSSESSPPLRIKLFHTRWSEQNLNRRAPCLENQASQLKQKGNISCFTHSSPFKFRNYSPSRRLDSGISGREEIAVDGALAKKARQREKEARQAHKREKRRKMGQRWIDGEGD